MTLSSMTGFARSSGAGGPYGLLWEIKSVNAKGLDLRLRLPPGWDAIEAQVRKSAAARLNRGTVYATLSAQRENAAPDVRVNEDVLAAIVRVAKDLSSRLQAPPASVDGILAVKGVVELAEPQNSEEEQRAAEAASVKLFDSALGALVAMREGEGAALGRLLSQRLDELAALAARAEACAARAPELARARIAEQVAALIEASGSRLDPDRLHQEAVLIAARADIREELDRIAAHVAQTRELIGAGGPVGRRLDFLAQEFNREVNTCCSKANDLELTRIGLDMKNVVEQFREQVQNLE